MISMARGVTRKGARVRRVARSGRTTPELFGSRPGSPRGFRLPGLLIPVFGRSLGATSLVQALVGHDDFLDQGMPDDVRIREGAERDAVDSAEQSPRFA